MANLTMTHDEIRSALALKYGMGQTTCESLRSQAWQALTEKRDVDRCEFLMCVMACVYHYLDGIRAAAETLGITEAELAEAARTAKSEGRLI